MIKKYILILILIVVSILSSASSVFACSCSQLLPPSFESVFDKYSKADVVFVGTNIDPTNSTDRGATLKIDKIFKGNIGNEVKVYSEKGNFMCRSPILFRKGEKWLIYAYYDEAGKIIIPPNDCSFLQKNLGNMTKYEKDELKILNVINNGNDNLILISIIVVSFIILFFLVKKFYKGIRKQQRK